MHDFSTEDEECRKLEGDMRNMCPHITFDHRFVFYVENFMVVLKNVYYMFFLVAEFEFVTKHKNIPALNPPQK